MLAVFVIDSGEHTIIRKLVDNGQMPFVQEMISKGTVVPLASDAHVLDGSVFQTLLTGVNPGEHGIYKLRQLVPGTYRYETTKAKNSPTMQIWTELSRRGFSCCVFDVPKAYVLKDFNGLLVCSWGAHTPAGRASSVPPDLLPTLMRKFGSHPQPSDAPIPLRSERYAQIRSRLLNAVRKRAEICRYLLRRNHHDFFMTTFSESHVASHQFWHLREPKHLMYDAASARRCGEAIEDIYEAIDRAISYTVDALPADAQLVVMTQQGIGNNFSGAALLKKWLAARYGSAGQSTMRRLLVQVVAALGSPFQLYLDKHLPNTLNDRWLTVKFRSKMDVFMLPGSESMALLRVNLQGRESKGVVPPEQYRNTLEELRKGLLQLENPDTGKPAVAEVIFPQDIYHGQCQDVLPDIVVRWRNDAPVRALVCPRYGWLTRGKWRSDRMTLCHTGEGLAVIAGPEISRKVMKSPRQITDLNATFYRLLGENAPRYVEGSAIELSG